MGDDHSSPTLPGPNGKHLTWKRGFWGSPYMAVFIYMGSLSGPGNVSRFGVKRHVCKLLMDPIRPERSAGS